MRLDPSENIWDVDVARLSGRDRGFIFSQRAGHLLAEIQSDRTKFSRMFRGGVLRRSAFAREIGCSRSVLAQNSTIAVLLSAFEGRAECLKSDLEPPGFEGRPGAAVPPIVSSLRDRLKQGHVVKGRCSRDRIVFTDFSCKISGIKYEVPTVIWADGIDPVSDWLRHIVVTNAVSRSTAFQYAKILRAFLRYCRGRRRDWREVDDKFIIAWRDGRVGKAKKDQIVSDLQIVFQYYCWSEQSGILSLHVGVYHSEELPLGFDAASFPISARWQQSNKSRGWVSPLAHSTAKSTAARRSTPTDVQVVAIHEELLKKQQGERDALIAAWAEETGGRRFELLQIKKSYIPTDCDLARSVELGEDCEITIPRRKRGAPGYLKASPFLIMATKDWIGGGRAQILRDRGLSDPDFLFISATSGQLLHPDSVTKLMTVAFRAAGVKRASLHRLRAKAIVEDIERLVDGFAELNIVVEPGSHWAETILVLVSETAGHASPLSLQPYLNFVLNRRLAVSDAERRRRLTAKTRDLERRLASAKAKIGCFDEVMAAISMFKAGDHEAGTQILIAISKRMS